MKFVNLTKLSGNTLYINTSVITAIAEKDGVTQVFIVGDPIPFEVKEKVYDVLAKFEKV